MFWNMDFFRFDKTSTVKNFVYQETDEKRDYDHAFNTISMDKLGFNLNVNIQNYMAEAVLLGGNNRIGPTRINSLIRNDSRPLREVNNSVVITILSSENNASTDLKRRTTLARKTEIRIPGAMLNHGSLFISELDCYLMLESQLNATRELIARDVLEGADKINIPSTLVKQEPEVLYANKKQLAHDCLMRQDKINIRIGVDTRYGQVPDIVKTMRISILDNYFIPYTCYKLVYDPCLDEDQFVIENLYLASNEVYEGRFSELRRTGAIYIDHTEQETLFGKFYNLAIFADGQHYLDYVHQRKSQERFHEEGVFLANRSGDPLLKEEIGKLNNQVAALNDSITESDVIQTGLRATITRLKSDLKDRDDTINKIRTHHDAKMSADAVIGGLDNDAKKLDNERIDLEQKEKQSASQHRAAMMKNIADILKSGWGIVAACLSGALAIATVMKKYNIRFSMG